MTEVFTQRRKGAKRKGTRHQPARLRGIPRATFTIAGEGPQLPELRALADAPGMAGRISFPGFLPQEKLRTLCAGSHLFLQPSELGADEACPTPCSKRWPAACPWWRRGGAE